MFYAYEKNFHLGRLCYCKHPWSNDVRQMTADLQTCFKMLKQVSYPQIRLLQDLKFRDRESVKAFHSNAYLTYLTVCSLHLSHTTGQMRFSLVM